MLKFLGGLFSPLLYLLEDFFEQPLIIKGFILLGMISVLVMAASLLDTLPGFLEALFAPY